MYQGGAQPATASPQQQQQYADASGQAGAAAAAASNMAFPPNPMMSQYPLKEIPVPHPHDVLCGRGGATNNHLGNSHWRMLVATNKELYVTLPKRQKQLLSRSIVHAVRSQNPPGRFLQRDAQSDLWYDVGDARATEKTSQALREGAPKLRSKLKKGGDENDGEGEEEYDNYADSSTKAEPATSTQKVSKKPPPIVPQIIVHPPPVTSQTKAQKAGDSRARQQKSASAKQQPHRAPEPPIAPPSSYENHHYDSHQQQQQQHYHQYHQHHHYSNEEAMPPPPTPLDPVGDFSFGTISVPDAPDMGLENGFSFGSVMSVDPHQRHTLRSSTGSNNHAMMAGGLQGHELSFGYTAMPDADHRRMEQNSRGSGQSLQASGHHHTMPTTINENRGYQESSAVPPVDFGLEHGGLSAGSIMSIGTIQSFAPVDASENSRRQQMVSFGAKTVVPPEEREDDDDEDDAPQPVDYGLEPGGLSAGSMMSIGTIKLEDVGTSFGSAMSYAAGSDMPGAVDGGLNDVGTSFGSMTLGAPPPPSNAEFKPPEPLDAAQPTLLHQQRSTANLLDCGDSDSEDEQHSAQASLQKSADWEKLKATFEAQQKAGMYPSAAMPPSLYGMSNRQQQSSSSVVLPVAVSGAGVDSHGNNNMPPPPSRGQDDWRAYEASMLARGASLTEDEFNVPKQAEEDPYTYRR